MFDLSMCNCVNQCPQCGICCRFSCEHRKYNYVKTYTNDIQTNPQNLSTNNLNIGWICPKCKNSINPSLPFCFMCSTPASN